MAIISRSLLITGPAKVTFDSATFFTKEDIRVPMELQTLDIATSAHGKVDERVLEARTEFSLVPEGSWTAAIRAALWPYASTLLGASVFGAADKPLLIHSLNNDLFTFGAAAVTRMPDIILGAKQTMVGPVTFTCIRKDTNEWTVADSILAISSSAYSDATFAPANIKVQPYIGAWGAVTGFTAIDTLDGWTISFDLAVEPIETDNGGIIDYRFSRLGVMARCTPIQPTAAQILTNLRVQGTGNARGRSLQSNSADLTITGTVDATVIATLKSAQLKTAGYAFGATVLRNGEIGFVATRPFAAGVPGALFTLA